ncbi:MAG: EAL domain-containing protein [Rhodospirillales bacterium]
MRLFGPKMDRTTQAKRMLELDLHDAITARKLEIRYRPQIDLVTRRITTFEALLHWDHPVHGKVPAAHFVPLAEELGLICAVGQEVLEEACREASLWADGVSVAVNITAGQLADAALPAIVASALRTSGLAASRLVLEVSQAMVNSGAATLVSLQALRETGVRIAIDDFGLDPSSLRSLSSLNSLAETPIDEIKVHRSLVSGLCESRDRLATVRATIGLCAKLGIPCCAVGVESKDDLEILQNEKCPQVQGHLFGSALEAREIAALLDQCNPFALGPAGARRSGPVPFARILELTSDCVMVTTADMLPPGPLIVYFNQAFAKLSGYSAEELLGRCPTVLQGPDAIRTAVDFIRAALQTGNPPAGASNKCFERRRTLLPGDADRAAAGRERHDYPFRHRRAPDRARQAPHRDRARRPTRRADRYRHRAVADACRRRRNRQREGQCRRRPPGARSLPDARRRGPVRPSHP